MTISQINEALHARLAQRRNPKPIEKRDSFDWQSQATRIIADAPLGISASDLAGRIHTSRKIVQSWLIAQRDAGVYKSVPVKSGNRWVRA